MLKKVERDAFVAYVRSRPDLVPHPVEGLRLAAMQYTDPRDSTVLKAQAVYTNFSEGPVLVSYYVDEEQSK